MAVVVFLLGFVLAALAAGVLAAFLHFLPLPVGLICAGSLALAVAKGIEVWRGGQGKT